MPYLEIQNPDGGKPTQVFFQQFIMNPTQQVMAVAMDFDKHGAVVQPETDGAKAMHLGKLSEVNAIFSSQIRNSLGLSAEPWDWENYPDPEIILLTRQ